MNRFLLFHRRALPHPSSLFSKTQQLHPQRVISSFVHHCHDSNQPPSPLPLPQQRYRSTTSPPPTSDDPASSSISTTTSNTTAPKKTKRNPNQKAPPKENFAHKYLDPAARGELPHNTSIPKLAGRKNKGHGVKDEFLGGDVKKDPVVVLAGGGGGGDEVGDGGLGVVVPRGIGGGGGGSGVPPPVPTPTTTDSQNRRKGQRKDRIGSTRDGFVSNNNNNNNHNNNRNSNNNHNNGRQNNRSGNNHGSTAATTTSRLQRLLQKTTTSRQSPNPKNQPPPPNRPPPQQQRKQTLTTQFSEPTETHLNPLLATSNHKEFIGPPSPETSRSFQSQRRNHRGRHNNKEYNIWGEEIRPEEKEAEQWLSDTMQFEYYDPPPESRRRTVPVPRPRQRVGPSKEFMGRFGVFAYVSNIECPTTAVAAASTSTIPDKEDGEVEEQSTTTATTTAATTTTWADMNDPLKRHEISDSVARILGVPVENVFPSTRTTAFVGFTDANEAADAIVSTDIGKGKNKNKKGSRGRMWRNEPAVLTFYNEETTTEDPIPKPQTNTKEAEFVNDAVDNGSIVLRLSNLPSGTQSSDVVNGLYGVLPPTSTFLDARSDVWFVSPTVALLRLSSSNTNKTGSNTTDTDESSVVQRLQAVLASKRLQTALVKLGQRSLRIQTAHRQIVSSTPVGPMGFYRTFKLSESRPLTVSGEQPTDRFFNEHAMCLHLTNVPPSVTDREISARFSRFCDDPRDVSGSIERVVDVDGVGTGSVYVGFDALHEYQAAWEYLSSSSDEEKKKKKNGTWVVFPSAPASPARVHKVPEHSVLNGEKFGPRSYRTAPELWYDIHKKWREYVTTEDLETLRERGVDETVLEDVFLATRNYSPTFGVEDQARVGEKLREGYVPGQHFEEFVKDYVKGLLETTSTRENTGDLYKAMFFPDEEIDYDLFDREEERVAELAGEKYYGK